MKKSYYYLIGLGALAVYYFYSKASAGKNLKVNFQNLKFGKFTGFSLPITANFKILNGSSTPITIDSIVGEIFINNKLISTISQTNKINVSGNSETIYPIKVDTGIFDAINVIRQLIKDKKKFVVQFKGTANSTGLMIPIDQTIIQL